MQLGSGESIRATVNIGFSGAVSSGHRVPFCSLV